MAAPNYPLVDAAMQRVLVAARDADAAVEQCARDAQDHLGAARATEKAIAAIAALRAARVRESMAARTARRLSELEALEREALSYSMPGDEERLRLERALEALVVELTSEAP